MIGSTGRAANRQHGNVVGLLGEDRLLARLNTEPVRTALRLVDAVFDDVRDFADGAEQSDDITVLAIRCPAA